MSHADFASPDPMKLPESSKEKALGDAFIAYLPLARMRAVAAIARQFQNKDLAEDVAQSACCRYMKNAEDYHDRVKCPADLENLVVGIARNRALEILRGRRFFQSKLDDLRRFAPDSGTSSPEIELQAKERDVLIAAVVCQVKAEAYALASRDGLIFDLSFRKHYEGEALSASAIAHRVACSPATYGRIWKKWRERLFASMRSRLQEAHPPMGKSHA